MKRFFYAGVLLTLPVFALHARPASASAGLYQHCNFGGYQVLLNEGRYTLNQLQALGVQNDDLSSILVVPGWRVRLFEHDNFQGREVTLDGEAACLVDSDFNDTVSSVEVVRIGGGTGAGTSSKTTTVTTTENGITTSTTTTTTYSGGITTATAPVFASSGGAATTSAPSSAPIPAPTQSPEMVIAGLPAPSPAALTAPTPSFQEPSTPLTGIQSLLPAHNSYRAKHGAPAMTWSASLAADAQNWANQCVFQHAPFEARNGAGENLALWSGTTRPASAAAQMWYDEIKDYNYARPGFSGATGHFTQVIWNESRELGCGMKTCPGIGEFIVCRYSPAGNLMGNFPSNVSPIR